MMKEQCMYNDMKNTYKDTSKATNCTFYAVLPSKITASSTKHYIAPTTAFDITQTMGFKELLDKNGLVLKFKT